MMTKKEQAAKNQIMKKLFEDGYGSNSNTGDKVTYTQLLDYFDINLTSNPNVVAFCEMGKARIVVNENLDIDQVCFIIRHELLHEYLDHLLRMQRHIKQVNNLADEDDWSSHYNHTIGNMAADYELSNVAYTDADKKIAKRIKIGDKVVQGLVTDIDHPEWSNLSLEDIYDEANKLSEEEKSKIEQELQNNPNLDKPGDKQLQDIEDIKRLADILDDLADALDKQSSQNSSDQDSSSDGNSEKNSDQQDGGGNASNSENSDNSDNSSSNKSSSKQLRDRAEQLRDNADKLSKQADSLEGEVKDAMKEKDPFRTPEEVAMDEETNKRIADLKAMNAKKKRQAVDDLMDIHSSKIYKEREDKVRKEIDRYNKSSLYRFKLALNQLVKKQTGEERGTTWRRLNKNYAGGPIIRKGINRHADRKVPLINVYFDMSGSWDDAKIRDGEQAMGVLAEYVKKGKIKVDTYYFSNNVHSDRKKARAEGGTKGQPILDHIIKTQPDNVIVMTDSDIGDCTSNITLPGGVFFLFRGGRSENLVDHLSGKALTQEFDLDDLKNI